MEQDMEPSDYANIHDLRGVNHKETTSERRLLLMGMLTLGILCITQVALNISLRLAFNQKQEVDEFPLDSDAIAHFCQSDQTQSNASPVCSCYEDLLKRLLRKCQDLEAERDLLKEELSGLGGDSSADHELVDDNTNSYWSTTDF